VRIPTELERKLLDLAEGVGVMEVERVRLADRAPVIYSRDGSPRRCWPASRKTPWTARCT